MLSVTRSLGILSGLGLLFMSSVGSAGYSVTKEVRLLCGANSRTTPRHVEPAVPRAWHSVQSVGVEERGVSGMVRVVGSNEEGAFMEKGSRQEVQMSASCRGLPSGLVMISTTGSQQVCNKGELVEIDMDEPTCSRIPGQFVGVVQVTTTWDSEEDYKEGFRQRELRRLYEENKEAFDGLAELNKREAEILARNAPGMQKDMNDWLRRGGKKKQVDVDVPLWSLSSGGKLSDFLSVSSSPIGSFFVGSPSMMQQGMLVW